MSAQKKQLQTISEKYKMNQIKITQASPEDFKIIQVIGRQTFLDSFAYSTTEADMTSYLEESFTEKKIRAELANPDSMFFVAWDDENTVGYLKVNTGKTQKELQDDTALEIERIYVKSSHHGKMVGQLLYDKALEIAILQDKAYLWLGVWEENPRAIRFYEKNGFVAFDKRIFKMGNDEQTDIMMKKILTPAL
jgi:ribosomal protein S18 acetylase RimI-like enzyme